MRIFAIETSCDETALALVSHDQGKFFVEKSLVASQIDLHVQYGGVVPEVAARQHAEIIFSLLSEAGISRTGEGIDGIAVTGGPGLVGALRVGIEVAKVLAYFWKKPLVAVNHLEGHIYSTFLSPNQEVSSIPFPALCLLVSGGHTELILMKDHGEYELVGMTRDDAAGEAFDKVAKLLDLAYPGGPIISRRGEIGDKKAITFPRPMLNQPNFDFSFSGLKTAVLVHLKENPSPNEKQINDICASFQEAVVDVLITKTLRAVEQFHPVSVLLSGGVSANTSLREGLRQSVQKAGLPFFVPPLKYTTDNATMVAIAGYFRLAAGQTVDPLTLTANPNMRLA